MQRRPPSLCTFQLLCPRWHSSGGGFFLPGVALPVTNTGSLYLGLTESQNRPSGGLPPRTVQYLSSSLASFRHSSLTGQPAHTFRPLDISSCCAYSASPLMSPADPVSSNHSAGEVAHDASSVFFFNDTATTE